MFIIRRILLYVLPGTLLFISNEKFKVRFSDNDELDNLIKLILFFISVTISYTIVPYILEKDKKKVQDLSLSVKTLLGSLRKEVSMELSNSFHLPPNNGADNLKLNIRVFLPKRRNIKDFLKRRKYFVLKNHNGLHVKDIENLSFRVLPKGTEQGLVGQVFSQKCVKYDFNLAKNHSSKYYRLEEHQLDATSYCNFAIAAPIFKNDTKIVIGIITFDSEIRVRPYDSKWKNTIRTYNKIIHKIHKTIQN